MGEDIISVGVGPEKRGQGEEGQETGTEIYFDHLYICMCEIEEQMRMRYLARWILLTDGCALTYIYIEPKDKRAMAEVKKRAMCVTCRET